MDDTMDETDTDRRKLELKFTVFVVGVEASIGSRHRVSALNQADKRNRLTIRLTKPTPMDENFD